MKYASDPIYLQFLNVIQYKQPTQIQINYIFYIVKFLKMNYFQA
jgi:hypothetical protein